MLLLLLLIRDVGLIPIIQLLLLNGRVRLILLLVLALLIRPLVLLQLLSLEQLLPTHVVGMRVVIGCVGVGKHGLDLERIAGTCFLI